MYKIMENEKIVQAIDVIRNQMSEECNQAINKRLDDLVEDINNDFFTIVILGEFKRGKSTFVNALLGEKLLPMDVVPTTATINALMWSEEKKTYVIKKHGEIECGESSLEFLSRYTASEEFNVDDINYLKVGYPSEILKNNVVIVDTPGVSDINEHRVQVTYNFIPRADAVIFLLDSTSPLKRTEKEFIDEHLVNLGIDRVIFVANKFDYIDEEEVIEDIEKRLKNAFKNSKNENVFKELRVIPMSSSRALEGVMSGNEGLLNESGLTKVKESVLKVIEEGSIAEEKMQRYGKRITDIIKSIEREINSKINLHNADIDSLRNTLKSIDNMLIEEGNKKEKIKIFIENEEQNILAMTRKSLNYFHMNLKEEINDAIDNYKGLDFKDYIEKQVTSIIRRSMNRWVSTYFVPIDKIFEKLEKEVSKGLTSYFRTRIMIKSDCALEMASDSCLINIEAEDVSGVTTKAGIISAGAAGLMALIGGPILLPFISMAAFPVLQRKMLESKLNDVKISVKPEINDALNQCISKLIFETGSYISKKIENIKANTEYTYDQLFDSVRSKVELEINKRQEFQNNISEDVEKLERKLTVLNDLKNDLIMK